MIRSERITSLDKMELHELKSKQLKGGYRLPCDWAALLDDVLADMGSDDAWSALWGELYHQGDIGEASIAVVPYLIKGAIERGYSGAQLWAYVTTIEIEQGKRDNPAVPEWLGDAYKESIKNLNDYTINSLRDIKDGEAMRCAFGFLLWQGGERLYGQALIELTLDEIEEFLQNY